MLRPQCCGRALKTVLREAHRTAVDSSVFEAACSGMVLR